MIRTTALLLFSTLCAIAGDYKSPFEFKDPEPKNYKLNARASELDPDCKEHPEINFGFTNKKGRESDGQWAVVDTRVAPRGKLVIWMMGGGGNLPEFTSSYGMHSMGISYARGWFDAVKRGDQPQESWIGDIRLEATTGKDASPLVDIPPPDGMKVRAVQFVKWLAKENPQGNWGYFLNADASDLNWEDVIVSGLSHGATSAARFAMDTKVGRVVLFTGPRDQDQTWQAGKSATPPERFFAFAHMKDGGMKDHQYDRSWEMLGLNQFGPIVDVDTVPPPYHNSRQLTTDFGKSRLRVHNGVYPGNYSWREDDQWVHAPVWEYLFTHPIAEVGEPAPRRFDERWKLIKTR